MSAGAQGGILALDLSTRTGWAYGVPGGGKPIFGTWVLGSSSADLAAPWAALGDNLGAAIALHDPSLVVVEAPLPAMRQRSENIARLLIGMAVVAELVCWRRHVEYAEQDAGTIRSKLMSKARPEKSEIIAWCRKQGHDVVDDNAADALCVWHFAVRTRNK